MTANIEAGREMTRDAAQQREAYSALAKSLESDLLRHGLRLTNGDLDWAKDLAQDTIVAGYPIYLEGKLAAERATSGPGSSGFSRTDSSTSTTANASTSPTQRWRMWMRNGSARTDPRYRERLLDRTLLDEPLENALAALPEEQRLCVLLVDIEEMEYAEAGLWLLEIPVGTVRSRLARARLRLYTLLLPYARSRRLA